MMLRYHPDRLKKVEQKPVEKAPEVVEQPIEQPAEKRRGRKKKQ